MLNALREHYDALFCEEDLVTDTVELAAVIALDEEGHPLGLIPFDEEEVVKTRVPSLIKRSSGINANLLVDKDTYLLGYSGTQRTPKTEKAFENFREKNLPLLKNLSGARAQAFKTFLETSIDDPIFEEMAQDLAENKTKRQWIGLRFEDDTLVSEDADIKAAALEARGAEGTETCFSLLSGKEEPIARLHPPLKGLFGGQSSGVSLISFNSDSIAFNNTGLKQGALAPIGVHDAAAVTKVLNDLIKNNNTRIGYLNLLSFSNASPEAEEIVKDSLQQVAEDKTKSIPSIFKQITNGILPDIFRDDVTGLSEAQLLERERYKLDEPFYIIGLQPNASRASILFFYRDTFGQLIRNFVRFYKAASIESFEKQIHLNIQSVLLSHLRAHEKNKSVRKTETALAEAIIFGRKLPKAFYLEILERVNKRKYLEGKEAALDSYIESQQMAYIKAYLLLNTNLFREGELTVALNTDCTNTAYLLGRLFAVCDMAEGKKDQTAMRYKLQGKASRTPASVYPMILEKTNIRLRNDSRKAAVNDRLIGEIIDKFDTPFYPKALNQNEQGAWWMGYYQQRQAMFREFAAKKAAKNTTEGEQA